MDTRWGGKDSSFRSRISSFLARLRGLEAGYIGAYLMVVAVALRAAFWYGGQVPGEGPYAQGRPYGLLLALFGLLLLSEPWLTPRLYPAAGRWRSWYPVLYLVAQVALIVALAAVPPHPDFIPTLLAPLAMQAVLWFGRRGAVPWLLGFAVLTAPVLLLDWGLWLRTGAFGLYWDTLPNRLTMIVLYSALCFLVGGYAHRIRQAAAARRENERLFGELQATHRQLQDYAAQIEALAAAEERGRLARDLHDSVTQTLFSMNLAVQAARTLLARDAARAAEQLDRLQELARSAVAEIQSLVSELRPRTLAEEGLAAAVRRHVAERQARDGLRVELVVIGAERVDLPEAVVAGLYRIIQEALNNVVKHAGTHAAAVRLDLGGSPASVVVEDAGGGFEVVPAAAGGGHVGLAGMAERARQIGWQLTVESRPGVGTQVRAEEVG